MLGSRRAFLSGATAGLVASLLPRHAWSSDLSLSDRIDLLYSNQFHFNERGEPQITVGLMQGQQRVRLSAPEGLIVLPSGDGGTAIAGAKALEVTLGRTIEATQTYSVVLEELIGPHALRPSSAIDRWTHRGVTPHDVEVGTVFGVKGRVLDNRRMLLTAGKFTSMSTALEHAQALKREHGALGKLHPVVERRARGTMTARDAQGRFAIEAEGVLWFAPQGRGPITVHEVLSGTTMGPGSRSDRDYHGSIYVAVDRLGKLSVVNLISETDVLAGLVPAEIYASAPHEALKAQAVAARGQLVTKVGTRHLDDPFLLCAEQHCQVYKGKGHEHPRTTAAVKSTLGWVAMRPGQTQLVDTVYSANSGGHTEHNELVWPGEPDAQLRGRPDPRLPQPFATGIDARSIEAFLRKAPASHSKPSGGSSGTPYRWTCTLDPAAIAGNPGVPEDLGPVANLEVVARGVSGRATHLRLHADRVLELHGELNIRRALGGLRSSMFIVDRDRHGRFVLTGGGHGHGVGMCQHGAMGMAQAGQTYRDILSHYYKGAEITKLW